MKAQIVFVFLLAVALAGMARHPGNLSDVALRQYAMSFHDNRHWSSYPRNGESIGTYNDTPVIAEVRCSDVCPDYTRMVLRYALDPGPKCTAVDGVTVNVAMPVAIAVQNETFCVPRVLVEKTLYSAP